jgi:predicted glycosyltransferase
MRFFFYSLNGMGLGHSHRNLAIAAALTKLAPQASVLLATGSDQANYVDLPSKVEFLKLPAIRTIANNIYSPRRLSITPGNLWELRSSLLTMAVQKFRPDVMLVDQHPLGARGELFEALEALRVSGGRAALGLPDILDEKNTVPQEWTPQDLQMWVASYYDRVLVYGSRAVFDPVTKYDIPQSVTERTWFCGYVVRQQDNLKQRDYLHPTFPVEPKSRPIVLATSGEGEGMVPLLQTFIEVARGAPWTAIVVAGPNAPRKELQFLHHLAAKEGVIFRSFVPALSRFFKMVDSLVCTGCYNIVAEGVCMGIPTVCVPRTSPQSNQLIRAQTFARLGLLRVVEPDRFNAHTLRSEVDASLVSQRQELIDRAHTVIDFNGAQRAASHLLALAQTRAKSIAGLGRAG